MRNLIINWIHQALDLKPGEELYLPADTKDAQKRLHKAFNKEIEILKKIDAVAGSKLHAIPVYKDSRHWVMLKRIETSPLIGFKKGESGTERVIVEDAERKRRITMMLQDEMTLSEITAIEGELNKEDILFIKEITGGANS